MFVATNAPTRCWQGHGRCGIAAAVSILLCLSGVKGLALPQESDEAVLRALRYYPPILFIDYEQQWARDLMSHEQSSCRESPSCREFFDDDGSLRVDHMKQVIEQALEKVHNVPPNDPLWLTDYEQYRKKFDSPLRVRALTALGMVGAFRIEEFEELLEKEVLRQDRNYRTFYRPMLEALQWLRGADAGRHAIRYLDSVSNREARWMIYQHIARSQGDSATTLSLLYERASSSVDQLLIVNAMGAVPDRSMVRTLMDIDSRTTNAVVRTVAVESLMKIGRYEEGGPGLLEFKQNVAPERRVTEGDKQSIREYVKWRATLPKQ